MKIEIGKQYSKDYPFMAEARLHQSKYRQTVLNVPCDEYGNMLQENDAKALLNYYPKLNVREVLRSRYPTYSKMRDANMLRSEHMPFNLFGPFVGKNELAKSIYERIFKISIENVIATRIEYAPEPKSEYLNDGTSFDAYIEYADGCGKTCGIGVEVKYTELEYKIGTREQENIENPNSKYWEITKAAKIFRDTDLEILGSDQLRQIWRNHILGLSMMNNGDIDKFTSITIHPSGNTHFIHSIDKYKQSLKQEFIESAASCFLEKFISEIDGNSDILEWKEFLSTRYLFSATDYDRTNG